jgi:hypothetical protein
LGVVAAIVGLAGCSALEGTVKNADMADKVVAQLTAQIPTLEGKVHVDCGQGTSPLEVGTVLHCDLTVDDQEGVYDVTVTITRVEGREFYYDYKVAETPKE